MSDNEGKQNAKDENNEGKRATKQDTAVNT